MPACSRTSRSNPIPLTVLPSNVLPNRLKAEGSWSMIATS